MNDISLQDLLDLSIGSPHVASVNFSALHALLKSILGHLKIQGVTAQWEHVDQHHGSPPQREALENISRHTLMEEKKVLQMEEKVLQKQKVLQMDEKVLEKDEKVLEKEKVLQMDEKVLQMDEKVLQMDEKVLQMDEKVLQKDEKVLQEEKVLQKDQKVLEKDEKVLQKDEKKVLQMDEKVLQMEKKVLRMEEKVLQMEEQMSLLESLPNISQLLGSDSAVSDMWNLMKLSRKTQSNEDGVTKCMALIQELLTEIQTLKEFRDDLTQKVTALHGQISQLNMNELADRMASMEQYCHQVEDLDNTTKELKEKLTQYPHLDELTQCVTWEVMQSALISQRPNIQEVLPNTISVPAVGESVQSLNQGTGETSQHVSSPHQSRSDGFLSRFSIGAEQYPETVKALIEVGRQRDRHESLEARVGQLEVNKADKTQLQHLSDLLTAMGESQIPDHVPEQLNSLRILLDSLIADKEKVSDQNPDSSDQSPGSVSFQENHTSQIKQMTLHISHIRSAVQKLEGKVQEITRETDDRLKENIKKEEQMQEQLNSLRLMLEDMTKYSSSTVSNSNQQEIMRFNKAKGHDLGLVHTADKTGGLGQVGTSPRLCQTLGQSQGQGCGQAQKENFVQVQGQSLGQDQQVTVSQDVDQDGSQLSQRYEKQKGSSTVMNQEHGKSQNTGLVNDVQSAIQQLQAEDEKLHNLTKHLIEEHSKKQLQIDHLYKSLVELEEKKADKELVEMEIEIKADKQALESKVSHTQFDSMTEQLNNMLQEVLGKINGQEKDWHKVMEKISTQMDCKLNRIELDPLKKQLEDRWKSIHRQLQTLPAYEQDDAAGIRKQKREGLFPTLRTVERPHRQTLTDLHPSSQPVLSPPKRNRQTPNKLDRITEMTDYGYLARNCGGSHTLTYPNRRYTPLQHITQLIQTEEPEVDIMGLDGHVYRGRMNAKTVRATESRLPTISSREGNCKSKDRVSHSQSQRSSGVEAGRGSPVRPQSARTHPSRSASSSSVQKRPMSSIDCLSQPIALQSSFQDTDHHKNLHQ